MTELDLQLPALRARYADGSLTPVQVAEEVLRRILARGDDGVWIAVSDRLTADAEALDPADAERLPLWGVPFAVKDNIDVLGLPTTAACPSFAHWPTVSAEVVSRLVAAGALVVASGFLSFVQAAVTSSPRASVT